MPKSSTFEFEVCKQREKDIKLVQSSYFYIILAVGFFFFLEYLFCPTFTASSEQQRPAHFDVLFFFLKFAMTCLLALIIAQSAIFSLVGQIILLRIIIIIIISFFSRASSRHVQLSNH